MNVLITGASRGIGRACAEKFASEGHHVVAVARSEDQLKDLAANHHGVEARVADLRVETISGNYDVLVLNAGYYAPGTLIDPTRDVFAEAWQLNVMANHRLVRSLIPGMIRRGSGHLVVIGSTSTDDTSANMTAYAATKKALRGLWEGWVEDLGGTGVRTTLVAPGATLTSSWANENPPPRILQAEEVADLVYQVVAEGLTGRKVIKAGS